MHIHAGWVFWPIYININIIYILTFFLTYTRRQLCAILQFMQFILVFNVVKKFFFTFFHFFRKKFAKPKMFVVSLHRNQMRHESSEMASLTKVSSRVRDCSAPHLLLSPFEQSSLGAPRKMHRTIIARSSRCHRTHVHV